MTVINKYVQPMYKQILVYKILRNYQKGIYTIWQGINYIV